ncbi:pectin acetylesterase-family hydrolase [Peredibacter starrii]|uniref:Pectin acetylesterase-family hydrolase n=1 Tax=Peredibacter starrii TaxID=28202 RepID=A0AAX4HSI3_9BACT|nr:pectin acetylesterase-family hydrolase [Peredibacter starrii]WPU66143.1 pectin acetylesterase-family hydrolase [Peredibacter starrii]
MKQLLLSLLFITTNVFASPWETVTIPNAKCGDGVPFKVFVRKGKRAKLAIELMGGGACWSLATCWGPKFHTWIHPIPELPAYSYLTTEDSPLRDHTFLYFPYCNGDVYAGNHTANYFPGELKGTHHHGKRNLIKALDYLKANRIIDFPQVKDLVAFGSSAGAIGSLLHADTYLKYMRPEKKLLIADSPGLHYGPNFWKKFTPELMRDFGETFAKVGIHIDLSSGLVAPQLKNYCNTRSDWKMGFIQTTRDVIMSAMFGDISQEEHKKVVLGREGIRNTLRNTKNCSTHISEGIGHMLLIIPDVAANSIDIESGESAKDYVDRLINEQQR